jgi:hypothetical protein
MKVVVVMMMVMVMLVVVQIYLALLQFLASQVSGPGRCASPPERATIWVTLNLNHNGPGGADIFN